MLKSEANDETSIAPLALRPDELLDRALATAALPPTTQRLLAMTRSDKAEIGPIVETLSQSPSLAAAVLRLANSSTYGSARKIGDLSRAVIVIGMQELHDVVAGTAMLAAFGRRDPVSEYLQATAGLSAAIAQKLTVRLKYGAPSSAYLAGLMCELGALACLALDPPFAQLHLASEGNARRRFALEQSRYGSTTPAIGARILAGSGLPTQVAEAVATTGLEPEGEATPLGRTIAFSRLAAVALLSAAEHGDPDVLRSELTVAASIVGLQELDPELLMQTCLAAAPSAELTLKGGLSEVAATADDSALEEATTLHTGLRPKQRQGRGLYVALIAAAVLAIAGISWFLLR